MLPETVDILAGIGAVVIVVGSHAVVEPYGGGEEEGARQSQ
jgi:hypothetical protein